MLLHFHLDKREDSQAASKTEEAYFEERYEKLEVKHGVTVNGERLMVNVNVLDVDDYQGDEDCGEDDPDGVNV